jgi:hypothetical protein
MTNNISKISPFGIDGNTDGMITPMLLLMLPL